MQSSAPRVRSAMFQSVYESVFHNPLLFFAAGVFTLLAYAVRQPFLSAWLVLFWVELMADAYLTGGLTPVPARNLGYVTFPFVILGDLRFFLLAERYGAAPDPAARTPVGAWLRTLALSFLVPVTSHLCTLRWPRFFAVGRHLFLVYEALLLCLVVAYKLLAMAPRARRASPEHAATHAWLARLAYFVLLHYSLWIVADVLLLSGVSAGYGLRVVPNVLYYACFLPYAYFTAPRPLRS